MNPGDTPGFDAPRPADEAPLNEGRGVNPGDTTPACPAEARSCPLNEGRGVNPGDTLAGGVVQVVGPPRSTKAGA